MPRNRNKGNIKGAVGNPGGVKFLVLRVTDDDTYHRIGWFASQPQAILAVNKILKEGDYNLDDFIVVHGAQLALSVALDATTPMATNGKVMRARQTTGRGRAAATGAQAQA